MPYLSPSSLYNPNLKTAHDHFAEFEAQLNPDAAALPLVCCGDWCGGHLAEDAMISGLAASREINHSLRQLPLSNMDFLQLFSYI